MKFKVTVIQEWEGCIQGEVLITNGKISFLGDIDQTTGEIVGDDLDIKGENIKDKIFIFSESRGSTVGSNVIYGLAKNDLAPKLFVTQHAELLTIAGVIYGQIPMVSNLPKEAFKSLKKGDTVTAFIKNGVGYLKRIG